MEVFGCIQIILWGFITFQRGLNLGLLTLEKRRWREVEGGGRKERRERRGINTLPIVNEKFFCRRGMIISGKSSVLWFSVLSLSCSSGDFDTMVWGSGVFGLVRMRAEEFVDWGLEVEVVSA